MKRVCIDTQILIFALQTEHSNQNQANQENIAQAQHLLAQLTQDKKMTNLAKQFTDLTIESLPPLKSKECNLILSDPSL